MADNSQRLGDLLDALAVLKELERQLTRAAEQHLSNHPDGLDLTVAERVANTVSNRELLRARWGDNRPIYAAEQFLRAGAAVALGGNKHHLAAVVYLSTEWANVPERYFLRELAHPERASDEMASRWERYGPSSRGPKPPSPFEERQERGSDLER